MHSNNNNNDDDDEASFMIATNNESTSSIDSSIPINNPNNNDSTAKPSFHQSYAYYLNTLPRRIDDSTQPTGYRLAKPNEFKSKQSGEPAVLYDPFFMDTACIDEFGIGIGLYFRSLKGLTIVILCCALISLVSIQSNSSFNPTHSNLLSLQLKYNSTLEPKLCPVEILGSTYGASREDLKLASQGAADIAIIIILTLFGFIAKYFESRIVMKIDDNNLTTQDYSVVITNPPASITNPDIYFDYFGRFGKVCAITIAMKNGGLCTELAKKKKWQKMFAELNRQPVGSSSISVDQFDDYSRQGSKRKGGNSRQTLLQNIERCEGQIVEMSQRSYEPWKVFVTFQHESEQIHCLKSTSVSLIELWSGVPANENALLQNEILMIKEAPEPSDVIYQFSHIVFEHKLLALLASYALCGALLVLSWFIITTLTQSNKNGGNISVAVFIALINSILPELVKFITVSVEYHERHSSVQRSILTKLVIVRCVNSGLIIFVSTAYDKMFALDHLQAIQNILIADAVTSQILRFLDIGGVFQRYVLGMFATTQAQLNELWGGADWYLAERYTDVLKTVFVGIFFAVPVPSGLFITAFALINTYVVDKYSLARLWKRAPSINANLSAVSRHFFTLGVWAHVSVSRIYFANWPFEGIWDIPSDNFDTKCSFFFCNLYDGMSSDQRKLTSFYNFATVFLFALVLAWFLMGQVVAWVRNVFGNKSSEDGYEEPLLANSAAHQAIKSKGEAFAGTSFGVSATDHLKKSFCELQGENLYIPFVELPGFEPVICVDVSAESVPPMYADFRKLNSGSANIDVFLESGANIQDPNGLSVAKIEEFPFLKKDSKGPQRDTSKLMLESMFGQIKFYPTTVEQSPREKTPAYFAAIEKETDELPIGYEKKKTKDGQIYYVNHTDRSTHWTLPQSIGSTSNSIAASSTAVSTVSQAEAPPTQEHASIPSLQTRSKRILPEGWSEGATIDGVPYYINHTLKTTQWQPPE